MAEGVNILKRVYVGNKVQHRHLDGLLYPGKVVKVDDKHDKCLVKWGTDRETWANVKDVLRDPRKMVIHGEIVCCICQGASSRDNNEIVLCDKCGAGYHQKCHAPRIEEEIKNPDVDWQCRTCVFDQTAKHGGAVKKGTLAKDMQVMKQTLPYNLSTLTWDKNHRSNQEGTYCYCGGPGLWYRNMLQCNRCQQWFHEACTQALDRPLVVGDRHYVFVCSTCNIGSEFLRRMSLKWEDLAQIALFNMTVDHNTKYYDFYDELMPWINEHWDLIAPGKRLQSVPKHERSPHVQAALMENKDRFQNGREIKKRQTLWGLRLRLPPQPSVVSFLSEPPFKEETCFVLKPRKQKKITDGSPVTLAHSAKPRKRKISQSSDDDKKAKRPRKTSSKENYDESSQGFTAIMNGHVSNTDKLLTTPKSHHKHHSTSSNGMKSPPSTGKNKQQTLDTIIPWPTSYDGYDHPFKTVLERNQEKECAQLKQKLLNSYGYTNGYVDVHSDSQTTDATTTDSDVVSQGECDVMMTSPLVAVAASDDAELPPGDTSIESLTDTRQLSPRSAKIERIRKKRGRKSKSDLELLASAKAAERIRQREDKKRKNKLKQDNAATVNAYHQDGNKNGIINKPKLPVHAKNVVDNRTLDGLSKKEIPLTKLKSSVNTYFGAADRLAQGEKFRVVAKRINSEGKVQYLVEWQGPVTWSNITNNLKHQ